MTSCHSAVSHLRKVKRTCICIKTKCIVYTILVDTKTSRDRFSGLGEEIPTPIILFMDTLLL